MHIPIATTKPPLDSSADNPITDIPQQSVTATQSRGMLINAMHTTGEDFVFGGCVAMYQ